MIRLTDNGEGKNATEDTYSLFAIASEADVQDPANPPWDVNEPFFRNLMELGFMGFGMG